jgi:hypothetical protein
MIFSHVVNTIGAQYYFKIIEVLYATHQAKNWEHGKVRGI